MYVRLGLLKNWCFWTVVLEKTLESPLDCKEIKPVHPKGYGYWLFIGRTDAEAETPVLWPPDAKNWLTGKDSDAGKDWRQEERGTTEDEMVGWHHQLREFAQTFKLVMESHHLILWHPLLLLPSIFPSIRAFSFESFLHIRWPKYWNFSFSPSNEYLGLISSRINWLDLFAVQGTIKNLLQHHS